MRLALLRRSALALGLAVVAWSAGCATAPPPIVDAAFASGAYAPARVAVLPPDVFVVLDQVGDNDPVQSAALGQAVSTQTVRAVEQSLRARGYDVDLSSRWDGIAAGDGTLLVNRDELGWLANGVLQFGNSRASGQVPAATPGYIAPELAAKVGWATQSDALLYVNVKGVATTSGKRTASVLAGVFIVVIVAAIVLAVLANAKGGGGKAPTQGVGSSGFRGQPVPRASGATAFRGTPPSATSFRGTPPVGGHAGGMPSGGFHGAPSGGGAAGTMPSGSAMSSAPRAGGAAGAMPSGGAMASPRAIPSTGAPAPATSGGWRGGGSPSVPSSGGGWRGGGAPPPPPPGAYVYNGRPSFGLGVGIDIVVPLDGPAYTHDGNVQHEDEMFAGDELWVSMTLVSTYDGRVLWHERQELDLDADDPQDVDRMVGAFLTSLPPRGGFPPAPPHK